MFRSGRVESVNPSVNRIDNVPFASKRLQAGRQFAGAKIVQRLYRNNTAILVFNHGLLSGSSMEGRSTNDRIVPL